MDPTLLIFIAGGIVLVLLVYFTVRFALRWMVRLLIVCLLFLIALAGAAWFWLNQSSRQTDKPRQTSGRRASSDRR